MLFIQQLNLDKFPVIFGWLNDYLGYVRQQTENKSRLKQEAVTPMVKDPGFIRGAYLC
jgi:hypothetical protein